ncbi:hypothetical protein SASPL_140764 [Salvia splendens]|uniref:Uncharacterized protein n=1 Tax=Salvia splendens TaxID=180675 RepID=A0A8X8WSA7_SALSN|nr:hypothetical protein SASPL_140764 [Salvia splendens]
MLAGVKMQWRKGEKAPWDLSDKLVQLRPYHMVEYIPAFPHIRPRRHRYGSSKRALFSPTKSSLSRALQGYMNIDMGNNGDKKIGF